MNLLRLDFSLLPRCPDSAYNASYPPHDALRKIVIQLHCIFSPAGHYAVAQRCEKIWWLGPRMCRAGSKPEATWANKSPLRHHAAAIGMLVEMRMASLYARCVRVVEQGVKVA